MQNEKCDVSIILVNYNTKDLLLNCIKSIYEKTQNLKFEIFIVDNNSTDDSCNAIENCYPDVKLIKNDSNLGFGIANNIAIKQSNSKYILCLNTDTLLINNAIKELFDYMENNLDTAVVGGNLYHQDMTSAYSHYDYINWWNSSLLYWLLKTSLKKFFSPQELKSITDVDFVSGADMFIRKSVLDEVGLFDENIFMYYEDMDLCKRIKESGYKIKIIPNAKIFHLEGSSCKNFLKRTQLSVKGKYYYVHRHCNGRFQRFRPRICAPL